MRIHLLIFPVLLIIITVSYGMFRAQTTLFGPRLTIYSPEPNTTIPQYSVLRGNVQQAVYLAVNDQQIFPNPEGFFEHPLLLPAGDSIVEVYAESRHNRTTSIHLPLTITAHDNEKNNN